MTRITTQISDTDKHSNLKWIKHHWSERKSSYQVSLTWRKKHKRILNIYMNADDFVEPSETNTNWQKHYFNSNANWHNKRHLLFYLSDGILKKGRQMWLWLLKCLEERVAHCCSQKKTHIHTLLLYNVTADVTDDVIT